ncbi:YigZ family protein [Gallaecimonas kandeliae]|uniref:YigZ family protein n=1 Tax=Gallaecimonas kandeliae TaxID=3029055 RepID=UPI003AF329A7
MSYPIPAHNLVVEETIRKSRFITLLAHTPGLGAARAFWQQCRDLHPNARHWCFAAVAGKPQDGQQYAMSDDGEPAGTAGKPMLAQLLGSGLGEISAVVVRYYGGVKLGTGGLVRAYGGGVGVALKQLETRLMLSYQALDLTLPYSLTADLRYQLGICDGQVLEECFQQQVQMRVQIPEQGLGRFLAWAGLQKDLLCAKALS